MSTTKELAQFVVGTPSERVPDSIIHQGKRCFINYLAVALYSAFDPSLKAILDVFQLEGSNPLATIIGHSNRTSLQNAALANGYLGHIEDYDDTHFPTIIHPSSPTIPAALAIGESRHLSGREVLIAAILGMEVCCRIGVAIHPAHYEEGWHITSTCGVFGAAAASSRLMGSNLSTTIHAFGLAGTQASGVREVFGSMSKAFHPGRAAQSGLLASLLAENGFTSTETIIEGRRGFAAVLANDYQLGLATKGLGERWELLMNGMKPYACGVVNHPLIDSMLWARNELLVNPHEITMIIAQVHPLVLELVDRPNPQTGLEGKFSFQHCMAVALIDGTAHPDQFTDSRVSDPQVVDLRNRIQAITDHTIGEDCTKITIQTNTNKTYSHSVNHAIGSPNNPMSDKQLETKFLNLTSQTLSQSKTERLLALLWNLEMVEDINSLLALTRTSSPNYRHRG